MWRKDQGSIYRYKCNMYLEIKAYMVNGVYVLKNIIGSQILLNNPNLLPSEENRLFKQELDYILFHEGSLLPVFFLHLFCAQYVSLLFEVPFGRLVLGSLLVLT